MDDFLLELLTECRRECEEAQRRFLAANNGLAALELILDDPGSAIIKYIASVEMIRRHWSEFRADLLPGVPA